ncbi:translation initiation factor IF-2 [Candidatus Dependentiae bacterium]
MRIYEYAKKNKMTSKELLLVLEKKGFEFASHMSVLTPEAIDFLDKKFSKKLQKEDVTQKQFKREPKKSVSQKKTAPKPPKEKKPEKVDEETLEQAPVNAKASMVRPDDLSSKALAKGDMKKSEPPVSKKLIVRPMVLSDFSEEIGKPATGVILTLLKWGVVCAKNQILTQELVERLAKHYEIEFEATPEEKIQEFEKIIKKKDIGKQDRLPVVVVMGHVDHGKTTLLDFVRKARVAAREKGGITQHLGAYEVKVPQGGIVFLDTPGHEAFSRIRMRGARAADIAILVIAADDGVMPQTIESIKHAKSVDLPIIVAINKVDRVKSDQIEKVKQQLTKYDLLPEDWGGDVVCAPISAKLGQGIDHLLEMIVLQSQMMDLKTDKDVPAKGYVLESKIQKGRGPIATIILQHGVAKVGQFFVCGKTYGKISSMVDSYGLRTKLAEPSIPVQIAGFQELPEAGDFFEVVSQQEHKRAKQGKREQKVSKAKMVAIGGKESFNLIVKADSDSSKEALLWAIDKLSKKLDKGFSIVQSSVGDISESDIDLAAITNSLIMGLHVKTEAKALAMAQQLSVNLNLYDIIYKLIDFLQEYSESRKEIKKELKQVGQAVVLRVFDIKGLGVIAGCAVKDGVFTRGASVVAYRRDKKVGEGKIKSLQREKKSVKEVHAGFECGFIVDGFSDWEVGDRVECYLELPQDKK